MIISLSMYLYQIICTRPGFQKMQKNESLEKDRLVRLRNLSTILGQPDLLIICKTTIINTFLSSKRVQDKDENFIFGLNFPTTAHFSSYINDRINAESRLKKNQIHYKIKFYVFDAFKMVDFQIQINIPGSLELKAFNLNGQPITISNSDYENAYFSSMLRSFYPYFYHPNTQIYGQIEKYEVIESFLRVFVPFASKNDLPSINEQLNEIENIGIELVTNYLKQNCFWNLCNVMLFQLYKVNGRRAFLFSLQLKQLKQQYKQIVVQCAQQLLKQRKQVIQMKQIGQFQIRALSKLKKKKQAMILGQKLIRQGLESLQCWDQLLMISFQIDDDKEYFKLLNTAVNLIGEESFLTTRIEKIVYPKKLSIYEEFEEKQNKSDQIYGNPEFLFKFDHGYLENGLKWKELKNMLEKNNKEKPTVQILHRLDQSMKQETFFQKFVSQYQKYKGWNKLLEERAQCFWLQNDYIIYQNQIRNNKQNDLSYRLRNDSSREHSSCTSIKQSQQKRKIDQQVLSDEQQQNTDDPTTTMNQSFEGQFSQVEENHEKQIGMIAPCSKRVTTKRVIRENLSVKKIQFSKILCNANLEKIFLITYHNLKLQIDIEKWANKLNFQSFNQISKQKKQLIAYMFLKKGFYHKNTLRFRKSQESFKLAKKCSSSVTVSMISCYCLAKLYLQHNNIKGVEYYTVQMVRILFSIGIEKYQVVPIWAKEIVPYIIKHYGKNITKRLQGPLKEIVELWLKIDNKSI